MFPQNIYDYAVGVKKGILQAEEIPEFFRDHVMECMIFLRYGQPSLEWMYGPASIKDSLQQSVPPQKQYAQRENYSKGIRSR